MEYPILISESARMRVCRLHMRVRENLKKSWGWGGGRWMAGWRFLLPVCLAHLSFAPVSHVLLKVRAVIAYLFWGGETFRETDRHTMRQAGRKVRQTHTSIYYYKHWMILNPSATPNVIHNGED